MTQGRSLSEDLARRAVRDTARALAYMHSKRIAHLDVKPENILAVGDGSFKLGDLGHATLLDTLAMTAEEGDRAYLLACMPDDFARDIDIRTPPPGAPAYPAAQGTRLSSPPLPGAALGSPLGGFGERLERFAAMEESLEGCSLETSRDEAPTPTGVRGATPFDSALGSAGGAPPHSVFSSAGGGSAAPPGSAPFSESAGPAPAQAPSPPFAGFAGLAGPRGAEGGAASPETAPSREQVAAENRAVYLAASDVFALGLSAYEVGDFFGFFHSFVSAVSTHCCT